LYQSVQLENGCAFARTNTHYRSSAQLVLLDGKPVEARHRERLRSLAAHKVRLKAAAAVRQNSSSSHDDDYYQQQQELNGSNEGDDNWNQRLVTYFILSIFRCQRRQYNALAPPQIASDCTQVVLMLALL
jgi:hypothetical protein